MDTVLRQQDKIRKQKEDQGELVSEVERERIFKDFYELESNDAQNKYLYGLIHRKGVRRRMPAACLWDGSHVQVCKVTFCALHAIGRGNTWIRP